jgi:CMP-N,N'-diacetyllegionaminic acid synthase
MILGITPARGGSKGIPRKNIQVVAGKPLIAWTIEAALRSKLLDEYVVSTEDEEIARIARELGARVLLRPEELAEDHVTTIEVLQHVVDALDPDVVVLLNATSPVRGRHLIDDCIRTFFDTNADSLATGFICKYEAFGEVARRRQDIEGFFYDDGNVYVIKSSLVKEGKLCNSSLRHYYTSREENINIDDPFDFWMAGQVLLRRIEDGEV